MLKPTAELRLVDGVAVAEFWDCLRLDAVAVSQLRSLVERHLSGGGRPELVVDLNGVGFAGSASLGGFIGIHKLLKPRGGGIILCNVDPTVRETIHVAKIDDLCPIVADLPEALARIAGGGAWNTRERPPGPAARPGGSPLGGRRRPNNGPPE
jgi:stage II sporulation protein AA (anti-sigma F factor antagonist)